jgi:hypothetical protein
MVLVEQTLATAAAFVDLPTEWRHLAAGSTYAALPARARSCMQHSQPNDPTRTSRGRARRPCHQRGGRCDGASNATLDPPAFRREQKRAAVSPAAPDLDDEQERRCRQPLRDDKRYRHVSFAPSVRLSRRGIGLRHVSYELVPRTALILFGPERLSVRLVQRMLAAHEALEHLAPARA